MKAASPSIGCPRPKQTLAYFPEADIKLRPADMVKSSLFYYVRESVRRQANDARSAHPEVSCYWR
jgi:3-methyladenine DNA glycosylase AlkC